MENIIRLPPDPHRETQRLLPWYTTGRLEAGDCALIEAHLDACAECQADLKLERRLRAEVADLSVDVDQAWASMLGQLEAGARGRGTWRKRLDALRGRAADFWQQGGPWLGWATAAALVVFVLGGTFGPRTEPPAQYHVLSSPPAAPAGNLIVIFQPQTSEAAMREALRAADTQLVGGPTAADAYVLQAPSARRADALARLRADKAVVLAEPIDPGGSP